MKLGGAWLSAAPTQAVFAALAAGGAAAHAVGGCVRNALLGAPVADIDIATDAPPERVIALAAAAGLRAVPTGIAHGTVTVVSGGIPHEVTTFRRDVATDGRHATVAFGADLAADAARRDFTMNALYADADGTLRDPLGEGLADLAARRLRFVGDARARIAEDHLRILRFFRFTAWYAAAIDAEGLAACAEGVEGIARLSRERVGAELKKLLAAPGPAPALGAMAACGALALALPGADPRALGPLLHFDPAAPLPARLAALGGDWASLRLARAEAREVSLLRAAAEGTMAPGELGYRLGAARGAAALALRAALLETPPPPGAAAALAAGAAARFPLRAADLPLEGPALGAALRAAEAAWIASGFTLSRAQLQAAAARSQ